MKENTDTVRKEIFRNNNDMKRENKKGVDALDGKLSKLVAELRTVVENQGEEIEKNQKFAIKLKK
jgi:hypothetical protein|tara:strand:+ start:166 stop:360 length:195 start_codon:yes stop_codon:yes gene_type:complete